MIVDGPLEYQENHKMFQWFETDGTHHSWNASLIYPLEYMTWCYSEFFMIVIKLKADGV